jgi:myosin heavy subunit
LDAHWCVANDTSGEQSQCPLLEEILAIGQLNDQSVILIDDARLFLAPPPKPHEASQWPSLDNIINKLHKLSNQHEIMVINDVIVFYPTNVREPITEYAREVGVDWLRANQSLTENGSLREAIEEKEAEMQEKHEALMRLTKSFEEKEAEMQEKQEALMRLTKSFEEKEAEIKEKHEALMRLTKSFEEKEAEIKEKHEALMRLTKSFEEKEAEIKEKHEALMRLTKSFEEKEAEIKEKHEALMRLTKSLEEKEVVLQELNTALIALRIMK